MNYIEMGLKIRILREEKRLTQMMLAELTGMTDREISNIESGKVTPLFSSIYEIAKALNTSIDYLVSEGDDPDKGKYIHDIAVRLKNLSPADIIHISDRETQEMYRKKFKGSYNKKWIGYVMVDELGNLIKPDYITESFPRLLNRHGMRRIRFHYLRHTSASLLLSRGVPLKDIKLWLGHSDFSTTANTYAHLDSSSKKTSLEALAGVVHF